MGKTAVVGAEELVVKEKKKFIQVGDQVLHHGDVIGIDGMTGEVFVGYVPVTDSAVTTYLAEGLEAGLAAAADDEMVADLIKSVDRLLTHADHRRRLAVRANADTPDDAARALSFGAQGIGLCRTEHMFLGERRALVERVILSPAESQARAEALAELERLQFADFEDMLRVMNGREMTVRLIDPPLHEFLPDLTQLEVKAAVQRAQGEELSAEDRKVLEAVRRLHETNPMLGTRGVRLGILLPGLFALQIRALAQATLKLKKEGLDPRPEIMVPLVGSVRELHKVRVEAEALIRSEIAAFEVEHDFPIGCMVELPRAAITADDLARDADFFSFGTNDLTQTVWGFSRDDVEGTIFPTYIENSVFGVSPFETIDQRGVGELVRMGAQRGRSTKPNLKLGICGEHGGDPDSIHFFHKTDLNYVSCSPFRVPVARLEAGRAAVLDG